jgi:hypothetical protein
MSNKKQTVKEELKPVETKKRDTSTDVAIMVACIMDMLEDIKKNIKLIATYTHMDHGGQ